MLNGRTHFDDLIRCMTYGHDGYLSTQLVSRTTSKCSHAEDIDGTAFSIILVRDLNMRAQTTCVCLICPVYTPPMGSTSSDFISSPWPTLDTSDASCRLCSARAERRMQLRTDYGMYSWVAR